MEITWYGHCCFRVGDRGRYLLMDPYGPEIGPELGRKAAQVVTVSHDDPAHNNTRLASGRPYVVYGPGEYEVAEVFITGVRTYRDAATGAERGANTMYAVDYDGVIVCHLGALGHVPSQEQIDELGDLADVDVLLVPVGGRGVLTAARAAETVALFEPRIVIPMHYRVRGMSTDGDTATRFVKEMGVEAPERVQSLDVSKSGLPDETSLVLLETSE